MMARIPREPAPVIRHGLGEDAGGRRTWTSLLPFVKPLSLNETTGVPWYVKNRKTKPWKDAGHTFVLQHRLTGIRGLERFTVVLHHAPRNGHEYLDEANYEGGMKPWVDGAVEAGLCIDDNRLRHPTSRPVLHPATGEPGRLWVVVVELGPDDEPGVDQTIGAVPRPDPAS